MIFFYSLWVGVFKERIFSLASHYNNNNNRMTGFSICFFFLFFFCSILDTVYVRNNDMEIESDVLTFDQVVTRLMRQLLQPSVSVVCQLINEKNVGHIPMIQSCEYTQSEE